MSLWGFDGGDNNLAPWSSLSQRFDETAWNEFGSTSGDPIADNSAEPSSWSPNDNRRKRIHLEPSLSLSTISGSLTAMGVADSPTDISASGHFSDEEDHSKIGLLSQDSSVVGDGGWISLRSANGSDSVELNLLSSGDQPVREDAEDSAGDARMKDSQNLGVATEGGQLFGCEDDTSMVTDHFSISDVDSQEGGLEIFENENVASKADSLLELGWENIGNLDDMDKLFRNSDASFEPVMGNGTDGLDWPSSSSPPPVTALDSDMRYRKCSPVPELAVVKLEVDEVDKTGSVFGDNLPGLGVGRFDVVADSSSPRSLAIPVSTPQLGTRPDENSGLPDVKSSEAFRLGNKRTKEEMAQSDSFPETAKNNLAQAYRVRQHAVNRKRSQDRFKQTTSYRRLSPGPPFNVTHPDARQLPTLPLQLPVQSPHLQGSTTFPITFVPPSMTPAHLQMPQSLPHIQAGYSPHHGQAIRPCSPTTMMHMQRCEPMFVDHQQLVSQGQKQPHLLAQPTLLEHEEQQRQHQVPTPFDACSRPPTSSPNMTPREKLEKLRHRQQMQARMAVEQQQQLLTSQNGETMYHKHQQGLGQSLTKNQTAMVLKRTDSSERLFHTMLEADPPLLAVDGDLPLANNREEDEDTSFEASVLCQLKSTVSSLEISTRLCIRDALYRLARSAMKRRAGGGDTLNTGRGSEEHDTDHNALELSTASGPPPAKHSRATSLNMVETETNPIDRSIAKLLFSKPLPPMFGRTYVYT